MTDWLAQVQAVSPSAGAAGAEQIKAGDDNELAGTGGGVVDGVVDV